VKDSVGRHLKRNQGVARRGMAGIGFGSGPSVYGVVGPVAVGICPVFLAEFSLVVGVCYLEFSLVVGVCYLCLLSMETRVQACPGPAGWSA
jgi:hypothetical protein